MYNTHMDEKNRKTNSTRSARHAAERRRAEQRGRRLTLGICAALAVALLCLCILFFRGMDGAPDASAPASVPPQATQRPAAPSPAPTRTPDATAAPDAAVPSPSAAPSPSATPQPSPTPLDAASVPLPAEVPVLETEDELTRTTILISAVGDCTLGGDVGSSSGSRFSRYADEYGLDYFFANVRDIFAGDDFTVVNLEGPLTTQTSKRSGRQFNFRGSPEYAQILSGSSVEVCTLANNHALDFREAGLNDTAANVMEARHGRGGLQKRLV